MRPKHTHVHDADWGAGRQPTRPDASLFEHGCPKRVASRVVGINNRCCGRGCTCILLLLRPYFLSYLGYMSVFVSTGMGAHTVQHNYYMIGCVT